MTQNFDIKIRSKQEILSTRKKKGEKRTKRNDPIIFWKGIQRR